MRTWKPDTCDCCVEEVYSGTAITGMGVVVSKCANHAAVPDNQLYGVLHTNSDSEQKRKNKLEAFILSQGIAAFMQQNAEGNWEWKPGIGLTWSWTGSGANRVITIGLYGATLTAGQKTTAQNWCNTQFGAGKVVIA